MKAEGLTSQRKKSGFYLDHERETTKGFSKRPLNTEKILLSVKKKKKKKKSDFFTVRKKFAQRES